MDFSQHQKFKLNPNAQDWTRAKKEDRSLYLTFSKFPDSRITKNDITTYFNSTYGQCIQSVVILPHGQKPPHSAKVIFNSTIIPWLRLPSLSLLTVIANRLYFGINLCCLMEIGRPQFWIWFQVKKVDTAYIKHFVAMLPEVYELDMIFNFHKLTTRIKLQSAVNNFQVLFPLVLEAQSSSQYNLTPSHSPEELSILIARFNSAIGEGRIGKRCLYDVLPCLLNPFGFEFSKSIEVSLKRISSCRTN
ncbi:hypothetical protein P8452_68240 [Trifolium repens]|nr:hypothetical protein P8452_68240 [Trifolium repens]